MKFFHALIILAASGGVATAKHSSTARAKGQERDRKRFLRIKQAESARRSLEQPECVRSSKGSGDCCINNLFGKSSKAGIIVPGDVSTVGCAEVCRPLCAVENAQGPQVFTEYPSDTCIVETGTGGATNGACPLD